MAETYTSLASYVATSNVAQISLSGWGFSHKHLVVQITTKLTQVDSINFNLNNNSNSVYDWNWFFSLQSTVDSEGGFEIENRDNARIGYNASGTSASWVKAELIIAEYSATDKYKQIFGRGGYAIDPNNHRLNVAYHTFNSNNQVNSIQLSSNNGLYVTGTRVNIYGLD